MKTLLLKPINFGFPNQESTSTEVWELEPDHLAWLMRREYRFLREEGASRRAARWHVHRMLTFLDNVLSWTATPVGKK